ncbi:MAG TPA: hypothetical protein PKW15_07695 [Alphaproteobacteria bacterium]|nr:hypothetical protein [Alphaproteobacteria bacterium]
MAFVLLHKENVSFDHEASLVNTNDIVSITPITVENGWHDLKKSKGRLALSNGDVMDVKEGVDQIINLLRQAMQGDENILNAGA